MVETAFTEEDKRNLRLLAEEAPKLRGLLEELIETMDVLSDKELMESLKASGEDVKKGRLLSYEKLLKELNLRDEEI